MKFIIRKKDEKQILELYCHKCENIVASIAIEGTMHVENGFHVFCCDCCDCNEDKVN